MVIELLYGTVGGDYLTQGSPSDKITDIELYLEKHQLHMFGIIESDLHGDKSRIKRNNPLTTNDILKNLHIDGYRILLPQSWFKHSQARLIVYVKEGVQFKERKLGECDTDLPSISVELGLGWLDRLSTGKPFLQQEEMC